MRCPNIAISRNSLFRAMFIGCCLTALCFVYVKGEKNRSSRERLVNIPLVQTSNESPSQPISIVPLCEPVLDIPKERVDLLISRLVLRSSPTLSEVLHALPVFGSETRFVSSKVGERVRALDLLLNADCSEKVLGVPSCRASRYGARFSLVDPLHLGTNQTGAESHPGQALAVLAGIGIPLAQSIKLAGDKTATLQIVLDDLKANFVWEGEIFWDAIALALYVPPLRAWKNKFGQEFTFDQLTEELLQRSPGESPCGGTHRLITLTVILRVDDQRSILSPTVRERVIRHLSEVVALLTRIQRQDGSWDAKWVEALTGVTNSHPIRIDSETERVMVTGHHLEWFVLLPENLRPETSTIIRAGDWLFSTSLHLSEDAGWVRQWYCPLSHAARMIRQLSARRAEGHSR
jgi:hypothetical protein